MRPGCCRSDSGADMMGLTLREARDLFEIQYLQAQLMRLGGNISRTAAFVGHGGGVRCIASSSSLGVTVDERG